MYFLVGAPAFRAGKERFSAPGKVGRWSRALARELENPGLKAVFKSNAFPLKSSPPAEAGGSQQERLPDFFSGLGTCAPSRGSAFGLFIRLSRPATVIWSESSGQTNVHAHDGGRTLVITAKAPKPGMVKTRLAQTLLRRRSPRSIAVPGRYHRAGAVAGQRRGRYHVSGLGY